MLQQVAAIDVAKASGKVCIRAPQGRWRSQQDVEAATGTVTELAAQLMELGIEKRCLSAANCPPWNASAKSLGVGPTAAQIILAEIGLDMSQFPTTAHSCRGRNCVRVPPSPGPSPVWQDLQGQPLPEGRARSVRALRPRPKTDTFLGERYRRIVKRQG